MNMTSEKEKQHSTLKKKLESLNFNQALGLDSVDLVDHLFNDLIKTSEAFQKMKKMHESSKGDIEGEKQTSLPLRSENMRLVKENNDLHAELIKIKEDTHQKELNYQTLNKKLNDEKEEFQFFIKQKDTLLHKNEQETEKLRNRLNETLQKIYGDNSSKSLSGADKLLNTTSKPMNIIGRKMEFEVSKNLDSALNLEEMRQLLESPYINRVEWANDLKAADERTENFRNQYSIQKQKNEEYIQRIEFLEKQISNRDLEIKRIHQSYNIDGNLEDIKVKYKSTNLEAQLEKLNSQIDFLNKENRQMEEKINFFNTTCNEKEVRKLENENKTLKKEKERLNETIKDLDSKVSNNKTFHSQTYKDTQTSNVLKDNEILKLNNQVSSLNSQIQNLLKELEQEKKRNFEATSENNTEKYALSQNISHLRTNNEELFKLKNEHTTEIDRLKKKLDQITAENNILKGREFLANQDIENSSHNINKIFLDYNKMSEENTHLKSKIIDLEAQVQGEGLRNQSLTKTRDSLSAQIATLNKEINNLSNDNSNIKHKADDDKMGTQKLEFMNKKYEMEIDKLITENKGLYESLEVKSNIVKDLTDKLNTAKKQVENSNQTNEILQEEYKNLSNDLTEEISKKRDLETRLRSYEKDFNQNKFIKDQLNEWEETCNKLKADKHSLEKDLKLAKKDINTLNSNIEDFTNKIEEKDSEITTLTDEKKKLLHQLSLNNEDMKNLENKMTVTGDINSDLINCQKRNNDLLQLNKTLKTENEKLKGNNDLLDFEVKKKSLEQTKTHELVERLKLDISQKNNEISEYISKIDQLNNMKNNEKFESHSCNQELLIQIENLKFEVKNLNFELTNAKNQSKGSSSDRCGKHDEKIQNYTNLLKEADKTRQELFTKFTEENNSRKLLEKENNALKANEVNLCKELDLRTEELNSLKLGLQTMDQNYDNLTNELDEKTEEISKLTILLKDIQLQNEELVSRVGQSSHKLNVDNKRLVDREQEILDLKNNFNRVLQDLDQANAEIQEKNNEIENLTFDMNSKTNENQNLIEDLTRIAKENERLNIIKTQLESNNEIFNQKFRANELDIQDLYQSYKETCQKNKRLEENLKIFVDENREAVKYIQNLENTLSNYNNNISDQITEKEDLAKKLALAENYNNEITEQIEGYKDTIRQLEITNDNISRGKSYEGTMNQRMEETQLEYQKTITNLKGENKKLKEVSNNYKSNLDYLTQNKEIIEKDLQNYQLIISEERNKQQQLFTTLQKQREDIQKLRDENTKLNKLYKESSGAFNRKNMSGGDTLSSNEEVNPLQGLCSDLQSKVVELEGELKKKNEENTRLSQNVLSERSVNFSGNLYSGRRNIDESDNMMNRVVNRNPNLDSQSSQSKKSGV